MNSISLFVVLLRNLSTKYNDHIHYCNKTTQLQSTHPFKGLVQFRADILLNRQYV